ncbi:MAG: class I SAM-dependent methyltransferase [Acidobacteriia bacterium]|nr:class I SAM-dependent methyltransferase [Terriglobia bacterium]
MLMYGWMLFVETAPHRYDWAVKVMTAGRIDRIKDRIAQTIHAGERVLDIGCGTGTLVERCLRRGAYVTGLDSSEFMLKEAEKHCIAAGGSSRSTLVRDSVTQLRKHFPAESFDVITSTMALGEFPHEYLDYILGDCRRLLRPGGRLIIADEVWPERPVVRVLYGIGLALCWIPQFVLLRRAPFPIRRLAETIRAAGFEVRGRATWAASSLQLIFAEKAVARGDDGRIEHLSVSTLTGSA